MKILDRLRAAWAAFKGTTALTAVPTPASTMKIADSALWEAARHRAPAPTVDRVFARLVPMKGVLPSGMAMDSVSAGDGASQWAASQDLISEGMTFLGFPYLAQLSQRAEYRMIVEKWAEHATRKWIKFTGDDERIKQIEAEFDRLNVRALFREVAEHDGYFGRSQIFMDFGDANKPAETSTDLVIDKRKVNPRRPLQRLKHVEPVWSYPGPYDTTNPLDPGFYRPRAWYIYGRTVSASRLLTFVGRDVPDVLKPAYAFGGLAMTQMAKPYVDNWLRTRQSVSDMIHAFSCMVLKTDMTSVLSGDSAEHLYKRIDLQNQTRDNRGTWVIDKDEEELENIAVPLSGLDKLQAQSQEQMSSVAGIPLVILLGVTPSGLNASSDGEVRSFYAAVKAYQERVFRPNLIRLLDVAMLSLWGEIDPEIGFEFEDLWEMSDKDKADIRKSDAEADGAYIDRGVVSPDETRERLANDETSLYHGVDLSGPAPEIDVPDADNDDVPEAVAAE